MLFEHDLPDQRHEKTTSQSFKKIENPQFQPFPGEKEESLPELARERESLALRFLLQTACIGVVDTK